MLTFTPGFSWTNGATATPTRLNELISLLKINAAANKLLGTVGAGEVGEINYTAVGLALLQAADAAAQRTALGLGTAATQASGAFDLAGAAAAAQAAAQAASQPVDADLSAIAALATTPFGRGLLTQLDAAAARSALGLGTASTQASGSFEVAGAAALAQAASQPVDADLTAIAALTTTAFGRDFLALADTAALRTKTGFGTLMENQSVAVIRSGTLGADLIFDTVAGTCALVLTPGTWLMWGSCSVRTSDVVDTIWLGFRDITNGADFGKGAAVTESDLVSHHPCSCFGFITVATGTPTVRLKAFRNGTSTLEMGGAGLCATMGALKLY